MTEKGDFVDATDIVDELLAEPEIAEAIKAGRPAREAMNRAYAMNLAMIRNAAHLTQAELAKRLGTDQPGVSKLENRQDMLLSTLSSFIAATGSTGSIVITTPDGLDYTFTLAAITGDSPLADADA